MKKIFLFRNSFIEELEKIIIKTKEKEAEVEFLINHLYNHKPILPALKDEFRKAGL